MAARVLPRTEAESVTHLDNRIEGGANCIKSKLGNSLDLDGPELVDPDRSELKAFEQEELDYVQELLAAAFSEVATRASRRKASRAERAKGPRKKTRRQRRQGPRVPATKARALQRQPTEARVSKHSAH